MGWQDFQPGDKGLQYGQPSMFSAAAYFNIGERNFAQVDAVRIVVTDFLGSDYTSIVKTTDLMKNMLQRWLLLQDMPDAESCTTK